MVRIAHISDIHFGKIAHPLIVEELIKDINQADVDLVVVSGDLTQRAFGHQFRAARRMLDAFDAPTLVVPGNHDVYPWWRIVSRLFDPLRRYRRLICANLAPRFELAADKCRRFGSPAFKFPTPATPATPASPASLATTPGEKADPVIVVQGINSAFGWTIQGGRILPVDLLQVEKGFENVPANTFKVLVVHHHLAELTTLGDHDLSKGAEQAFETAHKAKVDLILSGHLHISHVAHVSRHEGDKPIVVATSGTSTSSRGRGEDPTGNFYNVIDISPTNFLIAEKRFNPATSKYEGTQETVCERYN